MSNYLLPIAERSPLRWIVGEQRTAFPAGRAREAGRLAAGDRLLLYTTRGCFHNPTRDRGRVIGLARVTAAARAGRRPVRFGAVSYPVEVELAIDTLAPYRGGVELAPLVSRLPGTFPDPASWSARMRRALVPLAEADADLLADLLAGVARPYAEMRAEYTT